MASRYIPHAKEMAAWEDAVQRREFTVRDTIRAAGLDLIDAQTMVRRWVEEGAIRFIKKVEHRHNLYAVVEGFTREIVVPGRTREENMWAAMRMLRMFSATDISAHATTDLLPVTREAACKYVDLRGLELDGELSEARRVARDRERSGKGKGKGKGKNKDKDDFTDAYEKEREGLDNLVESEQRQIAMMLETDPVQREILRNHEVLASATAEERAAIEQLIAKRIRLEEIKSKIDEIGAAGESAFVGLVTGAHSLTDALSMVISKLAEMAASAAWDSLWGGIGGSLFSGLFGGGGSTGDTGIFGLGMPMADGGRVSGPGGPRDDKVAAWLSNGEFVVNASATAQHLPLIEAMNAGASMADLVALIGGARPAWPAFADGGLWGSVNGSSAPSGWGLSGSGPGGMSGGMGMMKVAVDVRAFFDDRQGKMMAEVQRVAQEISTATTMEGLDTFSTHMLPGRMAEIDANPRVSG